MLSIDVKFNSNSRPRNKLAQVGSNYRSTMRTLGDRPYLMALKDYEYIATFDTTVATGLNIFVNTLISSLGEVEHPDPEIQAYLRYNLARLEDVQSEAFATSLHKMFYTSLWSGNSVTESCLTVEGGVLLLDSLVTYHPSTIVIRTNKKGRLIEGEPSYEGLQSGIFQSAFNEPEVALPLWRVTHLVNNGIYGNYYGRSVIDPIYKWHLLKEALVDMMATALDRFGNPFIAITIPVQNSGQTEIDPNTGEQRQLTTTELIQRQLQSQAQGLSGGNVLLLPQIDPQLKPDVKTVTTGNNVGDMYLKAIEACDREETKGICLPWFLMAADINIAPAAVERQIDIYNRIMIAAHRTMVNPVATQALHRLVKLSFNRESAKIPPTIPLKNITRAEDRVALMQMITGLTNQGYFNPMNGMDWGMVRQLVNAQDRAMDKDDLAFIDEMLIKPKQKPEKAGEPAGRDRSKEGTVKGNIGAGRPSGVSSPLQTPRDKSSATTSSKPSTPSKK